MRTALSAAMVIAIIAFAAPVAAQLNKPWLGVKLQVVEGEDAKLLGISGGLKVLDVKDKSPAQEAGLEVGDVILSAGEDTVTTIDGFGKVMAALRPGDLLSLGVRRAGGRNEPLLVTLGTEPGKNDEFADDARVKELRDLLLKLDAERRRTAAELEKRLADLRSGKATRTPDPQPTQPPPVETPEPEETKPEPETPRAPLPVTLGAVVENLNAEQSKKLGIEGGVKVARVVEGGAAEAGGLKADDIISKAAGEALTGTGHLRLVLAKMSPGDKLEFEVLRDGKTVKIEVTLRAAQ